MCQISLWQLRALLIALTFAAYFPVWENGFVDFDDEVFITNNDRVKTGLTAEGFCWAWMNREPPYWMPITWLTFQLDAELSATSSLEGQRTLNPAVFHAQNLLWHGGCVLLLFEFCRKLSKLLSRAFLVAALFAIHPMHVESVAWAVERKDVLMCFFGLLSLHAYFRYVETGGWLLYLGMLLSLILSLMAKPMLLTFPFVLFLLDYWPLRRMRTSLCLREATGQRIPPRAPFGRLVLEKLPLLVVVLVFAVATSQSRQGVPFNVITLSDRFMNALAGYGWYLTTTFWPTPLAAFYPHPHGDWSMLPSLTGIGMLVCATGFCLWQANRRPWLIVGWLWFIGTLFPLIGFVQGGQQAWADRFSYWPHVGFFIALVWGCGDLAERFHVTHWISSVFWTWVLVAFFVLTWVQVSYWHDSTTLWEHALAVTERNAYAHQRLATCYRREGRITEADNHLIVANQIIRERNRRSTH